MLQDGHNKNWVWVGLLILAHVICACQKTPSLPQSETALPASSSVPRNRGNERIQAAPIRIIAVNDVRLYFPQAWLSAYFTDDI